MGKTIVNSSLAVVCADVSESALGGIAVLAFRHSDDVVLGRRGDFWNLTESREGLLAKGQGLFCNRLEVKLAHEYIGVKQAVRRSSDARDVARVNFD